MIKKVENCFLALCDQCKKAQSSAQNLPTGCLSSKTPRANYIATLEKTQVALSSSTSNLHQVSGIFKEDDLPLVYVDDGDKKNSKIYTPHVGIQMDSLLDLPEKAGGWKLFESDPSFVSNLKEKEIVTAAVIGIYDAGKSWLCNELSGREFSSGYSKRTGSLEICYPVEKDNVFGLIDTPGSQEALRMYQEPLKSKIDAHMKGSTKNLLEKNFSSKAQKNPGVETEQAPKIFEAVDDSDLNRFSLLQADSKIIQDLKEKFITTVADVTFLVVNKLSEKEQESVYKCIAHFKQINRAVHRNTEGKKEPDKSFIVVHNYKMLKEIDQVKRQAKMDIEGCFDGQKICLNTFSEHNSERYNNEAWKDHYDIFHVILACKDSPAGDYYNYSTLKFLKTTIKVNTWRKKFDFCQEFLKFANEALEKILGRKIQIEFNSKKTAIITKLKEGITLENLTFDEIGNFIITNKFAPRYSKSSRFIDQNKRECFNIDVETLDITIENIKCKVDKDENGWNYAQITGTKQLTMSGFKGDDVINYSREFGDFTLRINLAKHRKLNSLDKKSLGNGISRFIIILDTSINRIEV